MKLAKSLLLGSVAGFASVAAAQAADLPVQVKKPEYVRVCNTYGAGYYYIPGTDTCLRVGGRVRAEVMYKDWDQDFDDYNDNVGWRTRAYINLDARTATEYGTVRTYISLRATHNSGTPFDSFKEDSSESFLDRAFIQFAGLTAGRTISFFDFSEGTNFGTLRFSDGVVTNLLAYTATFGNGFSATLSLEDPANRRVAEYSDFSAISAGLVGIDGAGTQIPDIVASLRVDQSWGSAQLSAAAHQIRGTDRFVTDNIDDEWGFAVGLGAKINMDFLAPGDYFWINGTYTQGALGYMGYDNTANLAAGSSRLASAVAHKYTAAGTYDTDTAKGWQVSAGFQHYWAPTFRSSIFGSYAAVDAIDVTYAAGTMYDTLTPELKEWKAGANIIWSPVRNLDIGLEGIYTNAEYDYTNWVSAGGVRTSNNWTDEEKSWEVRLRIQRDF